jgi:hypothetical protein
MKKIIMILCCTFASAFVFAQADEGKKSNYPYWTISKDVQRLQFRDIEFQPINITTGTQIIPVSKGVSFMHTNRNPQRAVVVKMTGMPSSVISKGVARMQYEREMKR